jgi:hypothetical protein
MMGKFQPTLNAYLGDKLRVPPWLQWRPDRTWAVVGGCLAIAGVIDITKVSPFLYFQF